MVTHIERTLDQARSYAQDKSILELSRRSGIAYATLHDLLRVGLRNKSLSNIAALERFLGESSDPVDNSTPNRQSDKEKANSVVNEAAE